MVSSVGAIQRRYLVLQGLRWLPVGFIAPVLVLVVIRDATLTQLGPLMAVYGATTALLELPTGQLADRIGRRPVLIGSSVCSIALFSLLIASSDVTVTAVALFFGGVSRALDSGPLESWFVDEVQFLDPEADIQAGLSRGGAVDGVALAVGSVIGGVLPQLADGRVVAAVVAALCFQAVHLVAVASLMKERRIPRKTREETRRHSLLRELRGDLQVPALRRVLAGGATIGIGLVAIETLWQPRFVDILARDDITVFLGVLLAAAFFVGAAGSALAPRLESKLGARISPTSLTQALAGVALVLLAAATWPPLAALAFLLFYGLIGATSPLRSTLLHESANSKRRATLLSVDSLTFQAAGFVGALCLPAVAGARGIPLAWVIAASVLCLGSLLYPRR